MSLIDAPVRLVARSTRAWRAYFEANLQRLLDIPWKRGADWSEDEKTAFVRSLQDFQLGESSEGRFLKERARRYAAQVNDADYEDAIRLFIQEEQRHARLLAEYLRLAHVPLLTHSKLDLVFRLLRRLAGLELCITFLVIAETIGKVYYHALRHATKSDLLRRICDQLLHDEVMHLRFHAERLALMRRQRPRWRVRLRQWFHRVLHAGASLAVWLKHRRVFRFAGVGFVEYWRRCRAENQTFLKRSDPASFASAVSGSATSEPPVSEPPGLSRREEQIPCGG